MRHAPGFADYARATDTPRHRPHGVWYDHGRAYCACGHPVAGTNSRLDHLHGGLSATVEPHGITRVLTGSEFTPKRPLGWYCGTCDSRLVYGRDGKYRHRREP